MSTIVDLGKEILTLLERVSGLSQKVERLERVVADNQERIIRLESREELLLEKMKVSIHEASIRMQQEFDRRLVRLEELNKLAGTGAKELPNPKGE